MLAHFPLYSCSRCRFSQAPTTFAPGGPRDVAAGAGDSRWCSCEHLAILDNRALFTDALAAAEAAYTAAQGHRGADAAPAIAVAKGKVDGLLKLRLSFEGAHAYVTPRD